jgi:hypothetical protein
MRNSARVDQLGQLGRPSQYPAAMVNRHGPQTVNLYEAKSRLSELVDRAAAGEGIVIAKAGSPKVIWT